MNDHCDNFDDDSIEDAFDDDFGLEVSLDEDTGIEEEPTNDMCDDEFTVEDAVMTGMNIHFKDSRTPIESSTNIIPDFIVKHFQIISHS
jgi:hypothetical protein